MELIYCIKEWLLYIKEWLLYLPFPVVLIGICCLGSAIQYIVGRHYDKCLDRWIDYKIKKGIEDAKKA